MRDLLPAVRLSSERPVARRRRVVKGDACSGVRPASPPCLARAVRCCGPERPGPGPSCQQTERRLAVGVRQGKLRLDRPRHYYINAA